MKKHPVLNTFKVSRDCRLTTLTAFALVASSSLLSAQVNNWINPGSDTYNNPANWSEDAVPSSITDIHVDNGGTILVESTDPSWTIRSFELGQSSSGQGNITLNGGSLSFSITSRIGEGPGGSGALTVNSGSLSGNSLQVYNGSFELSGGTVNLSSQLNVGNSGTASLLVTGGTLTMDNWRLGQNTGSLGTATVSNGSITTGEFLLGSFDADATLNLSGGTVNVDGFFAIGHGPASGTNSNTGELNQSGGVLNATQIVRLGRRIGSHGIVTLSAGAEANFSDALDLGHVSGALGTVNLNGGTLTVSRVGGHATAARSVFLFNGGVLRAGGNALNFMQGLVGDSGEGLAGATILSGGAIIDNNGFDITIAQPLTGSAGDGGLTVRGSGTVNLSS